VQWRLINKFAEKLIGLRSELFATLKDYQGLALNLLLTCFRYLLAGISMVLLLSWFDVSVPLFDVILIQAVTQFATFVPLTTMGLGIQEAITVYLFGFYNVAADIILAVSIWGRAIFIAFIGVAYFIWLSDLSIGTLEQ
jgi:uncharacterized protein (TIRG00374 family)